jgi:hypothetical protein
MIVPVTIPEVGAFEMSSTVGIPTPRPLVSMTKPSGFLILKLLMQALLDSLYICQFKRREIKNQFYPLRTLIETLNLHSPLKVL